MSRGLLARAWSGPPARSPIKSKLKPAERIGSDGTCSATDAPPSATPISEQQLKNTFSLSNSFSSEIIECWSSLHGQVFSWKEMLIFMFKPFWVKSKLGSNYSIFTPFLVDIEIFQLSLFMVCLHCVCLSFYCQNPKIKMWLWLPDLSLFLAILFCFFVTIFRYIV